ncbi:MAG: hypothetical protein JW891_01725 [Candidatus Lokiarchaeota archaeon]|nr:hypothetical protein [Candidatus Lokiarchaeota archaeon]
MVKIRLCPKCMKPTLKAATNVSGWLAPDMYECRECKYIGKFHVIVDSKDYEEEMKKKSNDIKNSHQEG